MENIIVLLLPVWVNMVLILKTAGCRQQGHAEKKLCTNKILQFLTLKVLANAG